jgi:hypothetical protein
MDNVSTAEQPTKLTAGLDLGDKYSHLCLRDTDSGEVLEEGRLCPTPEAFRRRFESGYPLRIDIPRPYRVHDRGYDDVVGGRAYRVCPLRFGHRAPTAHLGSTRTFAR